MKQLTRPSALFVVAMLQGMAADALGHYAAWTQNVARAEAAMQSRMVCVGSAVLLLLVAACRAMGGGFDETLPPDDKH